MAAEFDWLTLEDGEEVLWSSRAHTYSLYVGLLVGALFVLVGSVVAWLSYDNTHYVVTNERIYAKRGIVSRNVKTVDFEKVQNINYTQSALGAQFGYGNVEISTAGSSGAEVTFRSVPDPAGVQELIDREITRRQGDDRETGGDADDVLEEIVTELRTIRNLLEEDATVGSLETDARGSAGATSRDRTAGNADRSHQSDARSETTGGDGDQ